MSAFNLGSIRAVLGLDSSEYTKGILDAQVANEVFGHTITNFVNNPLLGTVQLFKSAAVGTVNLLRETASLNQEIFRTAERTGFTTKTLSAMRREFADLGLSAEAVEKALLKMNQQVAAALDGTAPDEFAKIGIAIRDSNGEARANEEIYRDLTDRISEYGNAAQRSALVQKFFGEEALRAIQLLAGGSDNLDRVVQVWTKMGLVLRDEVAGSSDIAADAVGKLIAAFQGIKYTAATEFLGGFVGLSRDANESIVELAGKINEKLAPAARDAGEAIRSMFSNAKGIATSPEIEGLKELLSLYLRFREFRDEKLLPAIVDPAVQVSFLEGSLGQRNREQNMLDRFNARQIEIEDADLRNRYMRQTFNPELALLAARMAV